MVEYIPKPEDVKSRNLVLLLDGTGDSLDEDWTNVAELKAMLYDGNDEKQKGLYLSGLGTSTVGQLKTKTQKFLESTVGLHFDNYVIEPYLWLAQNYREGDKIHIFGFSRGAYSARAVAGMIKALGLLPPKKATYAEAKAAHTIYKGSSKLPDAGEPAAVREEAWKNLQGEYKKFRDHNHPYDAFIEFLGCWDTVNSVGADLAIKLSYTRTNDIVRNMRHAISLDEHRGKFKQNNWSGVAKDKSPVEGAEPLKCITNAETVWFAGCHSDVGGGSVLNGTRPNLAHIPLRWMIRECFKTKCGLIFKSESLKILGIEPSSLYPEVKPRPDTSSYSYSSAKIPVVKPQGWFSYGLSFIPFWPKEKGSALKLPKKSEEDLDAIDAFAPAYDQLVLSYIKWGIVESWEQPTQRPIPGTDGLWETVKEVHNKMGRTIPPPETFPGGKIKVHRTVRMRMEGKFESGDDKGKKYVPLARVGLYEEYDQKTLFNKAVEKGWIEWVA